MQKTIRQALQDAQSSLQGAVEDPILDASVLLSWVLNKPRAYLFTWPQQLIETEQLEQFQSCIERRLAGEPVAYITGTREAWSLEFIVSPHTLIPRPETECLIETALQLFPKETSIEVLDLGTGSGLIALALAHERPHWLVQAVDCSEETLVVARKNAANLQINNVSFIESDWFTKVAKKEFDLIVSNPPYLTEEEWPHYQSQLKFEPRRALVSGKDGLTAIRHICKSAKEYLKPHGYLLIEHGFAQGQAVRNIFSQEGYQNIQTLLDLQAHERITLGMF